MTVGKRLKAVRKHFSNSQENFAKRLKINMFSVHRYESDARTPGLETLLNLRNTLKIDINWLLTGDGSMFGDGEDVSNPACSYLVGDIVELVSGSKPMTVILGDPKEVTCTWPNANDELQTATFPVGAIRMVE